MKKIIHSILVVMLSLLLPAELLSASASDRDMKAALIYNFAVFTTWPEENHVLNVCAFEEDQDNLNKDLLESRKVAGMPIHYLVINHLDQIKSCQVLYLEETKKIEEKKLFDYLGNANVLSILNSPGSSFSAAVIKIQLENNKYTFSINNEAAKRINLTMSSKLLRLATRVY